MFIGDEQIDLGLCLIESAQCFCWQQRGGRFARALESGPVWLYREGDAVCAEGGDRDDLRRYLDLDRDYAAIAREYGDIPQLARAVEMHPGLRVLNQPPWEALICFILSANNNVQRIRGLTRALCERFGRRWDAPGGPLYTFPTPQALAGASEDALRALKAGYRAPYLIGTARRVCEGFPLEDLGHMPYGQARARLMELPGVGEKVADCVLLFGCGHTCAFPVDVWVARLLESWLGITGPSRTQLAQQARTRLGTHAGIAQQFLFHAARLGEIPLQADPGGE